jgi:cytochrome P450
MGEFDHHSPEFAHNWREQYRELRGTCPVLHVDAYDGFTLVTRYSDARRVLLSPEEFASGRDLHIEGIASPVPGGVTVPTIPFRMGMLEMDAPESSKLRKVLVPWFSPRAIDLASVHLRDMVTWCLDRVIEAGRMDIVNDLANPLPALVTLDLLGFPLQNGERYGQILHAAVYREKGSVKQLAWLQADIRSIVEYRRLNPPAIMTPVDALLSSEVDGAPLSTDLVVELVYMLLSGGIDTSTALIAHGLRYLSAHPEVSAQLRDDPSLIPAAVEEMLRYFTPGTGAARTALRDTRVGDVEIKAGERVLVGLGSANNDPDEFDNADEFVLGRKRNPHLAFGAGVHRCLGAFLSPREMVILVEEVLRRLPDLCVDESGVVPYESIPMIAGFRAMPATFTPGAKIGRVATDGLPPARSERDLGRAAELAVTDDGA